MLACLDNPNGVPAEPVKMPEVALCTTKQRLSDAFLDAVREVTHIENQQIQSVIEGDEDFTRFDLLLHFAQEQKDMAKYAWIAHVEAHGC
jgi:hypothetical protein